VRATSMQRVSRAGLLPVVQPRTYDGGGVNVEGHGGTRLVDWIGLNWIGTT